MQPSRRRQQSEETLLNEIFGNIVDSCIKYDKQKVFAAAVKKKDAPDYYDVIKQPIDLSLIKNKAKRQEYVSREQFMTDFMLLKFNAETYNGVGSHIAEMAKALVAHAEEQLDMVSSDVKNYEFLVWEKMQASAKMLP